MYDIHQKVPIRTRHTSLVISLTCIILLIPLLAMLFTEKVNWSISDFIIASLFLLIMGFTLDYAQLKIASRRARIITLTIILIIFLFIWIELAVGLFGTPFSGS